MNSEAPRFAVASFVNVYDTEPTREVVSLRQLVDCLHRFELKPKVGPRLRRELARLEAARERWAAGDEGVGRAHAAIREAVTRAKREGSSVEGAVDQALAHEAKLARDASKKGLRLWSAAWYRPGARRGTEGAEHMSCLVMDYDGTTRMEDALARWKDWFYVAHTTWSHAAHQHRFRVVLPLATPVAAEDWATVWAWTDRHTRGATDPACRSVGGTFALPAVAEAHQPRRAVLNSGPLLDPMALGLVGRRILVPGPPPTPESTPFRGPESDKRYVVEPWDPARLDTSAVDLDAAFDDLF